MEAQMNLLDMQPQLTSNVIKKTLLVLNGLILSIGTCGGPLFMRLYFVGTWRCQKYMAA